MVGCYGAVFKDCDELAYVYSTNNGPKSINANVFSNHVSKIHSKIDEHVHVPMHTLVIESKIMDRETNNKCSKELQKLIYEQCRDNDMKASNGRQINPVFYLYKGVPLMINSNTNLKEGRGTGSWKKLARKYIRYKRTFRLHV